jgi:hypothetical protein
MKKWIVLAAVCGLVAFAPTAQASILSPGGSTTVASIDVTTITGGSETLLATAGPFTASGAAFTAIMKTQVYQNPGNGWLDFVYTVTNEKKDVPTSGLERVTMFPYPNSSFTDVYYSMTSPVVPLYANRDMVGTVGFFFPDLPFLGGHPIAPGMTETLVIRTHDTVYGAGLFNAIDGSTATVESFAPAPLPSSLVLFGTGVLAFAGRMARRFRKGWLCLA